MWRTVLLLLPLLVSTQAWVDVKDKIKDRVIHIESLDVRGRWLMQNDNSDADGSKYLWFNTLNVRDTYYYPTVQFQTTLCDGGKYLCLESLSLPRYYLTAGFPAEHNKKTVKLSYSTYVEDKIEHHWKFLCEDESMQKCKGVPIRFESEGYLLAREGWDASLSTDLNRALIRIHAPNPSDGMREIYRNTNTGTHDHLVKYITMTGTSKTHETSETITSTTSVEIGGAFKKFSASASTSFSDSWTNAESSTYEESKTVEHDITIPGRTRVSLYQLVGQYASAFNVYNDLYCLEEEPLDAGASRSSRLMTYNKQNRVRFLRTVVQNCKDL